MTKLGRKKIKIPNEKTKILKALEDEFQLSSLVEYDHEGQSIGGLLLKKEQKEDYQIVFAFECKGIHPNLRQEQMEIALDEIESGLKELPRKERLTICLSSFTDDSMRQWELQDLLTQTTSPEINLLLLSEIKRTQELTKKGIRKEKKLILYGTYTIADSRHQKNDIWEQILENAENSWNTFSGSKNEVRLQKIEMILKNAYTEGYQFWEQYLSNKLKLPILCLNATDLWSEIWGKFNQKRPKPIPQLIKITNDSIREEINSNRHPLSYLLESDSSIPVADRSWVRIKNKYIGVSLFADKPGGWRNKTSQLRYLWNIVSQEKMSNLDIIVQIRGNNPRLLKDSLQSLAKQANLQSQLSTEKNSFDVGANLKMEKALQAQSALYSGEMPVQISIVFLLYRDTLKELDRDSKYLSSLFVAPAWIIREKDYAWKMWVQTLSLTFEGLLATPFDRRVNYLTSEVPGLLPLVRTRLYDKQGFELIGNEGGTPIFLDLFNQHRNIGVFATTRAGKSVLISGILLQALGRGIPITAIDFPKPDGTGTFSDFSNFLGDYSSYFDIGKEANNIFEPPDLSGLPPDLQEERFTDYRDFLLEILVTMVLGLTIKPDLNPDSIRSILTLAMQYFFADPEIRERYAIAFSQGFGSSEWWNIPTLKDFIGYCSLERLQISSPSGDIIQAVEFCKIRFRFWLESRVGKAISRPTTFRASAQLMIVALRNLSNQDDAAILSLGVYMVALRRSLAHTKSIFFIDEAPILFQYESLASLVGTLCANGAKSGIRVILSAQEVESIAQSKSSSKIFANLTTRLVGRIQPTAIDGFTSILKYPKEIIAANATESYFPKKEGLYSQWLLDDSGYYTPCRYYPSHLLLASVANNPEEAALRKEYLNKYPDDKFQAMVNFQKAYIKGIGNS